MPLPVERRITSAAVAHRIEQALEKMDEPPTELVRTMLDIVYIMVLFQDLEGSRTMIRRKLREALASPIDSISNAARIVHSLVVFVYYADPRVDDQVGYVRFRNRPRGNIMPGQRSIPVKKPIPAKSYDVVIAGSGVAGSVLAHRLAKAGKTVLVLEAGSYYPEWHSTDNELDMLLRYYKTGIFQVPGAGSLTVLQAKCVGGGAVINNAVCLRLPDFVKREWDAFGAALGDAALDAAFDRVAQELHILPADQVMAPSSTGFLNRSRELFLRGVTSLGIPHGTGDPDQIIPGFFTTPVNLSRCLGCGYCNIGCAYDRKNNALFKYLPEAIASGNCDVVANVRVEEVLTEAVGPGRLRARALGVRLATGKRVEVKAPRFILSAGAIASSGILLRSRWIRQLGLPIGERFSANAGSPVQARFAEKVNAYDGLQITDYFIEPDQSGAWRWIAETWFNPPAAQSQATPGYFEEHFKRMKKYPYYASMGTLVGTEPVGTVKLNPQNQRTELDFTLPDSDLSHLKRGMRRCAEVFFEAGADEMLLMGRKELILRSKAELGRIDNEIREPKDLLVVGTGHPQGGNPMSDAMDGSRRRGALGTDFKVHGVENLYVCDASVFPTSIKVNPQWTIMALADLCSERVS